MNLTSPAAAAAFATAQTAKREIDSAKARLDLATATLAHFVNSETGTHTVEGVGTFVVAENNAYPTAAMEALLSPGQRKRCLKSSLDGTVVGRLYPDVRAAAKVSNGVKVTVK